MREINEGEPIPDGEYVVRYCRPGAWSLRDSGGFVIHQDAFHNHLHPNEGVSVNWLGYWCENLKCALQKVRETMTYKGLRKEGRFVSLNSTGIKTTRAKGSRSSLELLHRPRGKNKSHAVILPPGRETEAALRALAEKDGQLLEVPDID